MELIFIGDRFYEKSKSIMSSIYDVLGNRQDWGKVNCALRRGESVHIRPATAKEIDYYETILNQINGGGNNNG